MTRPFVVLNVPLGWKVLEGYAEARADRRQVAPAPR